MDKTRLVKVSKYLNKHLRHQPERLGLTLAPGGWVAVDELLSACAAHQFSITRAELEEVVVASICVTTGCEGIAISCYLVR